ncbi:hypothetical protein MJO28_001919 [Puccinia striiformis f. sp. tritici]|uniref:Uncharacterized protein n=1 Tax=Puccinia striiformis f. sp. tritici TaxID=168172 RepID=A0ACC0EVD3_9BASI|nr:hypothetical protein MJO28_001919 [Puccinia striiformis f. sp. tritici]
MHLHSSHSFKLQASFDVIRIFAARKEVHVEFCHCQNDQVRLIQMGYIGGSPKFPRTAFSIRLLHLHHILWKHSGLAMSPFSKSIDEFLDFANPLILISNNEEDLNFSFCTREWRRTLSLAVDAFREMLRREKLITDKLLDLGPLDWLADICPPCYGPQVPGKAAGEPDIIVCMDANFQQRRHEAASVEIPGSLKTPSLFVSPEEVLDMATSMDSALQSHTQGNLIDRCSEQHTAADDVRTGKTWKECDDTGLFGMACRHDQMLQMINIERSGEKCAKFFMLQMLFCFTEQCSQFSPKLEHTIP